MISNGARRTSYSLQLLTIFLTVERISGVWQKGVHQKQFNTIDIISLQDYRHYEQVIEINVPNPPSLLAHSILPSSTPPTTLTTQTAPTARNEPSGTPPEVIRKPTPFPQDACAEKTTYGSYGDTTTAENIEVPYNYEVQYEKLLDGISVNESDVINAIEIALSNSIFSSLFPNFETDMNNVTIRTTGLEQDFISSEGIAQHILPVNVDRRRVTEIIGLSAAPSDRATASKYDLMMTCVPDFVVVESPLVSQSFYYLPELCLDNCSSQWLIGKTECIIVEGMLTLFLSDLNDIESMIKNTALPIQNSLGSSCLVSAYPSILSILYIDQQSTVIDIDEDQDDSTTIDDKIGPDDDTPIGHMGVIISSIAALFVLLGICGAYLCTRYGKTNNNEQQSQHSINIYDDVTMGGSSSQ